MADYLTLAEVKAQSLLDLGTDYDAIIPVYITRASRMIDRATKRSFGLSAGVVWTFDGSDTKYLDVPDLNAVTLLRVKVGGMLGVWTVCPASDFFLEPARRTPGHPATWIEIADLPAGAGGVYKFDAGKRTVEITGDWGWAVIPDEIKMVCMEIVVRLWRQRGAGQSDSTGADNLDVVNIPRALSSSSRLILDDLTRTVIS